MRRLVIVDDEAPLLKLMERYLLRLGYQVEVHEQGAAAREALLDESRPEADLLVADLNLEDVSGLELVVSTLAVKPEMRAILCTGDLFSLDVLPDHCAGRVSYLQKPFSPQMLAETVSAILPPLEQAHQAVAGS